MCLNLLVSKTAKYGLNSLGHFGPGSWNSMFEEVKRKTNLSSIN